MNYKEFAVEVYDERTDKFVEQIDVFDTLAEAEKYIELNDDLDEPYYMGVMCIEYDENENEINAFRL